MSTLGERLKLLRKLENKTQREIGEVLGVGRTTISNYENDITFPSTYKLVVLAKYFNVKVSYIIGDSKTMREPDSKYICEVKVPLVSHAMALNLPKIILAEASEYVKVSLDEPNKDVFALKFEDEGKTIVALAQRGKKDGFHVICNCDGKLKLTRREQAQKETMSILYSVIDIM